MTSFEDVYDVFRNKINDFDIANMDDSSQAEVLYGFMQSSIARFVPLCKKLENIDTVNKTFTVDLTFTEIDILAEWMVSYWALPYLNNQENLRNVMNTADYNLYSPANLLDKIENRYSKAYKRAKSLMNEYSLRNSDIEQWKK